MSSIDVKVRALLAKTTARGAFPEEAASALTMARRLCLKHGTALTTFTWPEPPPGYFWHGDEVVQAGTKSGLIMRMLIKGATVEELAEATGWQRHTVRGWISRHCRGTVRRTGKVYKI